MNRPFYALIALCATIIMLTGCAPKRTFAGDWTGAISIPNPMSGSNVTMNLVFHVTQDDSGAYTATMDSVEQKAYGLKLDGFTVKDNDVSTSLNLGSAHATFTGKANADATKITGSWAQGGLTIPLELTKQADKVTTETPGSKK